MEDSKFLKTVISLSLSDNLDSYDFSNDGEASSLINYAAKNRILLNVLSSMNLEQRHTKKFYDLHLFKIREAKIKSMKMQYELFTIARTLNASNINYVFLKGSYYKTLVYQTPHNRFISDVDILIDEQKLNLAIESLLSNGFKFRRVKTPNLNNLDKSWSHQTPTLISPNGELIDIHLRVTAPTKKPGICKLTQHMLAESLQLEKYGIPMKFPAWEHGIFHLLYHAVTHDMLSNGPIFLYDLKEFFRSHNPENSDLRLLAIKFGLKKEFDLGLSIIQEIGIDVPLLFDKSDSAITDLSTNLVLRGHDLKRLNRNYNFSNLKRDIVRSTNNRYLTGNISLKNLHILLIHLFYKSREVLLFLFSIIKNIRVINQYFKFRKFISGA